MAIPATVFVTGTDTGVGKTTLTTLLLARLRSDGIRAWGMKPFCSGSREDAELIRSAMDDELPLEEINPFYFEPPLAPWAAARLEKRRIGLGMVLDRIADLRARCELLIIEGAGGLLSPLAEQVTALDVIRAACDRVAVVAPNKLGVLNHAQLTARALPEEHLRRATFVLMDQEHPDESSASNFGLLSELLAPRPVLAFPFLGGDCKDAGYLRSVSEESESLRRIGERILARA